MASAWSATLRERKVTGISCPYQVSNTKLRSSKAKAWSAGLAASSSTKTNDFLEVSKLLLQGDSTNDSEPCGDSHAGCCWMLLDTRPDRYMQLSGLIVRSVGGWKQLPQPQPQSDPPQTIPSQQSLRPSWCSTKRCNVHNAVLTVLILFSTIRFELFLTLSAIQVCSLWCGAQRRCGCGKCGNGWKCLEWFCDTVAAVAHPNSNGKISCWTFAYSSTLVLRSILGIRGCWKLVPKPGTAKWWEPNEDCWTWALQRPFAELEHAKLIIRVQ